VRVPCVTESRAIVTSSPPAPVAQHSSATVRPHMHSSASASQSPRHSVSQSLSFIRSLSSSAASSASWLSPQSLVSRLSSQPQYLSLSVSRLSSLVSVCQFPVSRLPHPVSHLRANREACRGVRKRRRAATRQYTRRVHGPLLVSRPSRRALSWVVALQRRHAALSQSPLTHSPN
jgi:hypothetical protein